MFRLPRTYFSTASYQGPRDLSRSTQPPQGCNCKRGFACPAAQRFHNTKETRPEKHFIFSGAQHLSTSPSLRVLVVPFFDLLGVHGSCAGCQEEEAAGEACAGAGSKAAAAAVAGWQRLVGRLLSQGCRSPLLSIPFFLACIAVLFRV
jgi:hypothetical protein